MDLSYQLLIISHVCLTVSYYTIDKYAENTHEKEVIRDQTDRPGGTSTPPRINI